MEWRRPIEAGVDGGDRLRRHARAELPFELINHYGPTENTVVTTSGSAAAGKGVGERAPGIGRPIGNTRCIYWMGN